MQLLQLQLQQQQLDGLLAECLLQEDVCLGLAALVMQCLTWDLVKQAPRVA